MSKKLIRNSFIYVFGDVLNKAVPFFMLPVLTRYLTPEDYGIISIFTVLVAILAVFTGLSVHGAININFFKMKKDTLKVFIGNTIIILNISTSLIFFFIFIFSSYITPYLKFDIEWLYLAAFLSFAQFITIINLILWVAEQKPKPYSIYQLSQTIVTFSLSLLLVVGLGLGWKGEVIAIALSTCSFSIISFIFIVKRGYLLFTPNKEHIKDALTFGVPLIPHALSGWFNTGADRFIILWLLGTASTGTYSVAYQIGMVLGVLVTAINKAWGPHLIKIISTNPTKKEKEQLVKYTYIYFISVFILAILLSYAMIPIIPYYLGNKFTEVTKYLIYINLAFAFQGMYFMVVNYIFYVKKTYLLAYITFSTSLIHVLLVYIMINKNGLIGSAQVMLASYLLAFIATWILSNRVYNMPWVFWRNTQNAS